MKAIYRVLIVVFVAVIGCGATPVKDAVNPADVKRERDTVVNAMHAELDRSMKNIKFRDYESPYFMAYAIEDWEDQTVSGKFGALLDNSESRSRSAYVEVRVGDYGFDNYANIEGEAFRLMDYQVERIAPVDNDPAAIRGILWLITDEVYKKAISDFLTKKGSAVYDTDEKTAVPSFSKEPVVKHRDELRPMKFDKKAWEQSVRDITTQLKANPEVLDAYMEVNASRIVRYFVNSEGSEVITERTIYSIQMSAFTRAEDGMLLDNGRTFYARDADQLPNASALKTEADNMLAELMELRSAPVLDPYSGPAILAPEASGVLFHEVIGHRLEGERQRNEEEGRTFKGRIGKEVIPAFLTVRDDPTVANFGTYQLNGFYAFDDEGVKAANVKLIEGGVLKSFLKSRTPIEGLLTSNGHGRAQGTRKPMARMSNLIVDAAPSHQVPFDELKKRLMAETLKQGKPFGLIIRDITGGSTNTSGWGYQAFKGSPRLIYKVDPNTGAETLVRGVELVGTPLTSINKIVAASDTPDVFNGYCGAESGYVPVSTVAPALLTTEIELQRKQQSNQRPPILGPPWKKDQK